MRHWRCTYVASCSFCGREFVDMAALFAHERMCRKTEQARLDEEWKAQQSSGGKERG